MQKKIKVTRSYEDSIKLFFNSTARNKTIMKDFQGLRGDVCDPRMLTSAKPTLISEGRGLSFSDMKWLRKYDTQLSVLKKITQGSISPNQEMNQDQEINLIWGHVFQKKRQWVINLTQGWYLSNCYKQSYKTWKMSKVIFG